jgi:hypothetical protein
MNKFQILMRITILTLFLGTAGISYSQTGSVSLNSLTQVGGFAFASSNMHSADFQTLPSVFGCSPGYTSGSGFGFSIGGIYQIPINSSLSLQMRGAFSSLGSTLTREEVIGNARVNNEAVPTVSKHTLESSISAIEIQPMLYYQPLNNALNISFGLNTGLVVGASYSQKEELVSPSNSLYENGLRQRNMTTGDIPNTSALQLGALAGIGYDVLIGKSLFLTPEVQYGLQLTNLVSDINWKANSLRFGVSVRHILLPQELTPTPLEPDEKR